jgi:hypothetical protein
MLSNHLTPQPNPSPQSKSPEGIHTILSKMNQVHFNYSVGKNLGHYIALLLPGLQQYLLPLTLLANSIINLQLKLCNHCSNIEQHMGMLEADCVCHE